MTPAPRHATALHGRERELDAVVHLVRRGGARSITVTGAMGIGKSRLLDDARRRLGPEASRVRFVEAGALDDPSSEVALGPLAVPPLDAIDPVAVRRSPAVTLLADAARIAIDALRAEDFAALARVAAASGGHPIVLEQLAGWLALLSPAALASSLDEGSIELVPKAFERRLRSAVATLAADAREVLAALAIAAGPVDLRMARAAVRAQRRHALPSLLATLAARGFLVRVGTADAPRWTVLAPFRALFRGRGRGSARRRLTAYWAARARPILERAVVDRSRVTEMLEMRDELVASWEDAHARGDAAELALAAALASIATSGDPNASKHAERIRASLHAHPGARREARIAIAYGDALWMTGDAAGADARYRAAIARARRDRDPTLEAFGWIRRATLGPELGALDVAYERLAKGTALARRSNEPLVLTLAVGIRGFLLRASGDVAGALAAFDEQAELAERAADAFYVATADASAADCHLVLGEHALGRMRYARAQRAVKPIDPGWASTLEGYMGLAAWEVGALAEAASRCGRAIAGGLVGRRFRAVFTAARAGVLAELGEARRATTMLARAEEEAPHGDAVRAASLLVALASASDARSRRAVTARIARHLETRKGATSEDERAFGAALARAIAAKRAPPALPARALEDRPRLARVLEVLGSGAVTSAADIFRAAWPAERDAASTPRAEARVRKAVSLLRELGLRGAIVTTDGGYVLRTSP